MLSCWQTPGQGPHGVFGSLWSSWISFWGFCLKPQKVCTKCCVWFLGGEKGLNSLRGVCDIPPPKKSSRKTAGVQVLDSMKHAGSPPLGHQGPQSGWIRETRGLRGCVKEPVVHERSGDLVRRGCCSQLYVGRTSVWMCAPAPLGGRGRKEGERKRKGLLWQHVTVLPGTRRGCSDQRNPPLLEG